MRIPNLRTVSLLGMVATAAAGYGALPATAAPAMSSDTASALNVYLYCEDGISCDAYASGGSGSYTFTWTGATEYYSEPGEPGFSSATPHCTNYIGGLYVRVKVTDSLGATKTVGQGVACNPY